MLSCIQLLATPWTLAHQSPLSMGFSKQEYWSGFPCPPPGDLLNPGIKPKSLVYPALQEDSLRLEPTGKSNQSLSAQFSSVAQSCSTLCNPMDYSLPGSSVHGILQARILEWVAMTSSRGALQPRDQTQVSCVSCIAGRFFTHGVTWEAHIGEESKAQFQLS